MADRDEPSSDDGSRRAAPEFGLRVACELVVRRLARRRGEFLATVVGIGLALAAAVVLACLPSITVQRTLRTTLTGVPPESRAVTIFVSGERNLTNDELDVAQRRLSQRFDGVGLAGLRHLVSFRTLAADDGTPFRLGGTEGFNTALRVVSGRAPRSCTARRCEVVSVIDDRMSSSTVASVGLRTPIPEIVIVGSATRTDATVFQGGLAPEPGELLLVADGTEGVDAISSLRLIRRIHAWVAPIEVAGFTSDRAELLLGRLGDASQDVDSSGFAVSAPDAEISAALARSRTAERALALPRGVLAALLAALIILVGLSRRSSVQQASDRLARRGARRTTRSAMIWVDAAALVAVAALVAAFVGTLTVSVLSKASSVPVKLGFEALGVRFVLSSLLLILVAWAGLAVVMSVPEWTRGTRLVGGTDVAGAVAAFVLVVVLNTGQGEAPGLDKVSTLALWVIPVAVAVMCCAACARVVPWSLHRLGRLLSGRRPLHGASLIETMFRPLAPLALAGAVALAVMASCFGLSYRSTLARSSADQATFQVPFDARLTVASTLVRPMEVEPAEGWSSVGSVSGLQTSATQVLRRAVSIYRTGADPETVDVLAVEPDTLSALRPWRADYGPAAAVAAQRLQVPPPSPVGLVLPPGTRGLRLRIAGNEASSGTTAVVVSVILQRADDTWHESIAEWTDARNAVARLDGGDEGARLVGYRVSQPPETAKRQEHNAGEGAGTAVEATGVAFDLLGVDALGPLPAADSLLGVDEMSAISAIPIQPATLASSVAELTARPDGGLGVRVELQGTSAVIVPRVDHEPLPVIVDRLTAGAAEDGILLAETLGDTLELRVVGVASRFPTMGERFVVADFDGLSQRFNLLQPTFGTATELWLGAPQGSSDALGVALRSDRFASIGVDLKSDRLARLDSDPIGTTSSAVLAAASLLAAALAAFAVVLNVRRERSDGYAFHRALLLDGARPATIQQLMWVRSESLVLLAVPVGLAAGVGFTRLVVGVLTLSGSAAVPEPPIQLTIPWGQLTIVVVSFISVLTVVSFTVSRRSTLERGPALLRGAS